MDELNAQVLKGFGIKAKKIVKEKAYYICDTDRGVRVIRKNSDTCDSIFFQYEIKEHLNDMGFVSTDRYYLSKDDKPYFTFDDTNYVMTDLINYKESDFCSQNDFIKIIGQTAKLHNLARGIHFTGKVYYGTPDLMETFRKSVDDLLSIKKRLSIQSRYSDFDVLFIKNYNYYLRQIKSAIQLLEQASYAQCHHAAVNNTCVCHNSLKEENILLSKDDVYIVKFSGAHVGCQIGDLCSIVRRYVKSNSSNGLTLWQIVDIYDRTRPISGEELKILQPLLKYPSGFLKICKQYYSKKRTWIPNAITNRMESLLARKDEYERYISM